MASDRPCRGEAIAFRSRIITDTDRAASSTVRQRRRANSPGRCPSSCCIRRWDSSGIGAAAFWSISTGCCLLPTVSTSILKKKNCRIQKNNHVNPSYVSSDLFNLPLPPLWSVVLGEYNRHIESGYEQRITVDRIVMHNDYEDYQHDLGSNSL